MVQGLGQKVEGDRKKVRSQKEKRIRSLAQISANDWATFYISYPLILLAY